jgi:hypothetical protein
MSYTNESGLIEDIYDYLFENDFEVGTNFLEEFPISFIDRANARIHLNSETLGNYIVKIEKVQL